MVSVDTLEVNADIEQVYENSWVNGVSFINSGGSLYLCMFKDRSTLLLTNLFKRGEELEIPIHGTVNTFSSRNNTLLYITEEDYSTCHLLHIDTGNYKKYRADSFSIPAIFNDSFFIATQYISRLEMVNDSSLIIPYRVRNNTENLVDSFAYIWLNRHGSAFDTIKMIHTPGELIDRYEYLHYQLCYYDEQSHTLYFAFHKNPRVTALSLVDKRENSGVIEPFHTIDYEGKNGNLTYLRKYMKENDRIDRLLTDEHSNLFVFVSRNKNATCKSSVIVFDKNMSLLSAIDLKATLDATIAFRRHNKLYIYEEGSHGRFYGFSIAPAQLQ